MKNISNNRGNVPPMTPVTLTLYIITIIILGLFFFFVRDDTAGKICACTVCPIMIIYMIYAYFKEQKADRKAKLKNENILDGSYFNDAKWKEQYTSYLNEHPFERPKYTNMKKDLLARFRRREYFIGMLFMLFLMLCMCCSFMIQQAFTGVIGILLFGYLFSLELSSYIGMPVRKWLKSDIDYNALESSYLNSRMLTYKKNGLALGTTHIHAYTEKKIYAIDYRLVDKISRKIVRLKKYEDSIYSSEEYQHYASIHVRLPQSGTIHNIDIELNEFQVQMVIDNLQLYKLGENITENITVEQKDDNTVV